MSRCAREREVLALMARGRSNAGIGRRLWVAEGTVGKHVRSSLGKPGLQEDTGARRRALAVLTRPEPRQTRFPASGRPGVVHRPAALSALASRV